jgi:hypothetical protein
MTVTYYVVVPFVRDDQGGLKPGEAKEMRGSSEALRMARSFGPPLAGAVAFSRTVDLATGKFSDPTILGQFGEVDLKALSK